MKDDPQQQTSTKRQARGGDQQAPTKKRQKAVTDDLICAITRELPFDPVTAEDGRLYERAAIEQHISHCQGRHALKSPITNVPMGPKLLAMPQIKSLIETLIENRSITGDLVDAWKQQDKNNKSANRVLKQAQDGDAFSMFRIHYVYAKGSNGFKKDGNLAVGWLRKAHAAGCVRATGVLGNCFLTGRSKHDLPVPKNISDGLVLLSLAAQKGSDVAAANLGLAFALGKYGLTVDTAQAITWLQKALSDNECPFKDLDTKAQERCRKELENLIKNQGSDT